MITVHPIKYRKTVEAVRELSKWQGVSVLIAQAPCPLYDRTLPHFRKMRPFQVNAAKCRSHKDCVTNMSPQPPFTVAMGQACYPDIPSSMQLLAGRVKQLLAFDAAALALQAGSPLSLNMVMLGALAWSRATGIPADMFCEIVRTKTKSAFADINLKAFDLGMSAESQI